MAAIRAASIAPWRRFLNKRVQFDIFNFCVKLFLNGCDPRGFLWQALTRGNMDKPKCADFLVQAIRQIRQNPFNLKEGTKAGVAMHRLWAVTSEAYSEREFRRALARLLKSGALVAIWRLGRTSVKGQGEGQKEYCHASTIQRVASIPENMPLDDLRWYRHEDTYLSYEMRCDHGDYESIHKLLFYVVADGLPKRVPDPHKKTGHQVGKTAAEIIASMK